MIEVPVERLPHVLERVGKGLGDWRNSFRAFQRSDLRQTQLEHAKNGWGGRPLWGAAEELADVTKKARADREGHYANPPHPDAGFDTELFWTASLAEATAQLTTVAQDHAIIDTAIAYDGPIEGYGDPVEEIVREKHGGEIWPLDELDQALNDLAEFHAAGLLKGLGSLS